MENTITPKILARVQQAKTLHDLVRKPYKGEVPKPNETTTDRVAMLLMGSDGLSARSIEKRLGISTNQFDHALHMLDYESPLKVKRKQGKFRNTQLYYI